MSKRTGLGIQRLRAEAKLFLDNRARQKYCPGYGMLFTRVLTLGRGGRGVRYSGRWKLRCTNSCRTVKYCRSVGWAELTMMTPPQFFLYALGGSAPNPALSTIRYFRDEGIGEYLSPLIVAQKVEYLSNLFSNSSCNSRRPSNMQWTYTSAART